MTQCRCGCDTPAELTITNFNMAHDFKRGFLQEKLDHPGYVTFTDTTGAEKTVMAWIDDEGMPFLRFIDGEAPETYREMREKEGNDD